MNRSNRHHIQFRYGLITLLILLFSAAISYKLFSTTVIDAPKWNEKARRQLEKVDTIMPERGDISRCALVSSYPFNDTTTKRYRFQAVYEITYFEE